jgi:lipoprotein-anchoring transpeptidase ErfK/SrfK
MQNGKRARTYVISTSKYGVGNKAGSNQTPLGLHKIVSKIGKDAPVGTVFKRRRKTGVIAQCYTRGDLITTRIMRLSGLQKGVNKGWGIDSFRRCIYIHGTPEENLIGSPASHGCIRMKSRDIIDLFNIVKRGMIVFVSKK